MSQEYERIVNLYDYEYFKSAVNNGDHLIVYTLEGDELKFQFTKLGWLLNDSERYDTFEEAISAKSHSFKREYHNNRSSSIERGEL